ncbi:MAG TPA: divergent polysaccharide deacetylase family protein [Candidatus Acidoferrales bacterium]|nr:divergent polysaccharide deacetylase family protein [Candidatus Acidoferrales bacterium]
MRSTIPLTRKVFALLLAVPLLLGLAACRRKAPPPTSSNPNDLAAEFAAAARGAAGAESPIRIVPAASLTGALTRVLVSLPDSARLEAVESAWRSAAGERAVTFEARDTGAAAAAFAVSSGGKALLVLEVFERPAAAPGTPQRGNVVPELAIIVDDLGYDPAAARAVFALPGRVSVAVLPNLPESPAIAEEAHRRGIEVLLHLPMESLGGEDGAEKIELRVGEPAAEVSRVLDEMLSTVPYAVGVNNHQGSRATADPTLMAALAAALRVHGLFFIDSRTSAATRALDAARRAGVPAAARNVFLDDDEQPAAIRRQLELAERVAREQGGCVAIGHPHGATLDVLADALPEVEARGVRLVTASEIVRSTAGPR